MIVVAVCEVIRDPVERFSQIISQVLSSGILPPLPSMTYIRCPDLHGIPCLITQQARRPDIGSLLLVCQRCGYLGRDFRVVDGYLDDFKYFMNSSTGYYIPDVSQIPGYGEERPWSSETYDQIRLFYTKMKNWNDDPSSLVSRVPYSVLIRLYGYLMRFGY